MFDKKVYDKNWRKEHRYEMNESIEVLDNAKQYLYKFTQQ